jgi:hypothetical protein
MQIAASTRILIKKKNKLWTQWQRTHYITLVLINSLKEQIYSAIKEQLLNTWQKTLQSLDAANNTKETWRIIENLTNANHNIQPLIISGKTAYATQEKLKAFTYTPEHIPNT